MLGPGGDRPRLRLMAEGHQHSPIISVIVQRSKSLCARWFGKCRPAVSHFEGDYSTLHAMRELENTRNPTRPYPYIHNDAVAAAAEQPAVPS